MPTPTEARFLYSQLQLEAENSRTKRTAQDEADGAGGADEACDADEAGEVGDADEKDEAGEAGDADEAGRDGRGGATRARLYFGMSITRLIVLVLCICAGLAKIATAYVVQTHDTKEL